MILTTDGFLAVLGIVGVIMVGIVAWRRPEQLRVHYEMQLLAVEKKLAIASKRIEELEVEYRKMASDYLRIIGENHWLRLQLRANGIDIPPLPEDLRPHTDEQGNISIVVSPSGGVQVTGGHMETRRDTNSVDMHGQTGQASAGAGNTQVESK